jgi:hypothetical protein
VRTLFYASLAIVMMFAMAILLINDTWPALIFIIAFVLFNVTWRENENPRDTGQSSSGR